jgi:PAS domain S-box-containing protein
MTEGNEPPHPRAAHELRAAQAALGEANERLQLALAAGRLGDWTWDATSDEVSLSAPAAAIFGCEGASSNMTWAALRECLHPDDRERVRLAVEEALAKRAPYSIEYRVRHPGGEHRWVAAYGRGTYREDGAVAGMTGIVQDITSRKREQEAAQTAADERARLLESERAARAAAERLIEMKDQFLATLSHELRTPLSAILGWSQVLRRGNRSDADVQRGLETIERNARMQTRLIEDLLDMSRIASGKMRLDVQSVSPAAFVDAAVETVRPEAEAKRVALDVVCAPDVGTIPGDAARLQQVVWNLLSNAIKFTPSGGRVAVFLRRHASGVEIRVTDTGTGIPPQFLAHLFERFRQADASTTRRYGGLGLGLSIVKSLVEMHGGSVQAQSAGEGQGATFIVQLPASHAPEAPRERAESTADPAPARSLRGLKVLIVDDDADSRELMDRVLTDSGATVSAAASATEALALLQSQRPDVMVSDIGMPDVDGFELLKRIRALAPEQGGATPAVALTAFARNEDRQRAAGAGYAVHLAKPVESARLIETVAMVTGHAREGHS